MKQILLLLLIPLSLSAQVKGIVLDSISGKPIAYVNIWVETENIGTTSEENGTFLLEIKEEKNLVFSALGFETRILKSTEIEKVSLYPKVYEMPEVVLEIPKRTKEIEVGNSKKRFYLAESQIVSWIFAKKIDLDSLDVSLKFLKQIIYFTNSEVQNGKFRIRIFNLDIKGKPLADLLMEEIIVLVKKGKQKSIVDVSKFNIEIPKEGILVGFESLIIEENKYFQKARVYKTKKTIEINNYSPHILYHYSDKEISYASRINEWTKQLFSMNANRDKKEVLAPAINVILTN